MQGTAYQSIDENKFKLYKLEGFDLFIKGMQGQSVSTHGVILPMLIIQIQGYILGLISIILLICGMKYDFLTKAVFIIIIICFIEAIDSIIITEITGYVGKKRKNNRRY